VNDNDSWCNRIAWSYWVGYNKLIKNFAIKFWNVNSELIVARLMEINQYVNTRWIRMTAAFSPNAICNISWRREMNYPTESTPSSGDRRRRCYPSNPELDWNIIVILLHHDMNFVCLAHDYIDMNINAGAEKIGRKSSRVRQDSSGRRRIDQLFLIIHLGRCHYLLIISLAVWRIPIKIDSKLD